MTKSKLLGLAFTMGTVVLATGLALAHGDEDHGAMSGEPYSLATCPVTGAELGSMGDPVVKVYDGREIRFCCAACPEKFEADSETYLTKIDEAIAEQQRPFYPLNTCVISGEELGSMGAPLDLIYQNRLVRLCCAGCVDKFKADAEAKLNEIDAAVVGAQKESYPLDFCLVSGDELGGEMGETIEYVQGNRLYRVCCKGCLKSLHENPVKYQSMLDDALAGKESLSPRADSWIH